MLKAILFLFFLNMLVKLGYAQQGSSLGISPLNEDEKGMVKKVKEEFGFTFGAFLTEKKPLPKANFATYYQGVQEGCGTECVTFRMKDLRTSKIIDGPANCPGGFFYFPGSYLMICNSEAIGDENLLNHEWYIPRAFFWDEDKKAFFEIEGESRQ
jgi:hypothetical protein